MRYLTLVEVLELHHDIMEQSGGEVGLLGSDGLGLLESAIAQPRMTFGGEDLYPTIIDKAAALGFSISLNHAFKDGNKRVGHAAMEKFLILNGMEITASVDEQEQIILAVASGQLGREALVEWLQNHVTAR